MTSVYDEDLYRRTRTLLEPGDVALNGAIVHTDLGGDEDLEMTQTAVEIGDVIAHNAGLDPADHYVYSGSDDPEFASNQHQGRTLDGDEFVWESQHLLREGTFDLVFYYEATADHAAICEEIESEYGYRVTGVEGE
jgi:hypothetical protein